MMVKDRFNGVSRLSETEHCVSGQRIPSIMANGGVPKFPHTIVNRPHQLRTAITFPSELRFVRS